MKNIKLLILTVGLISLISFSGCGKFLDTLPDNRTEIDNIEKVSNLLINAYPKGAYASILETRCDGIKDVGGLLQGGQPSLSMSYIEVGFNWKDYDEIIGGDGMQAFWERSYRAISSSNFALEAMDKHNMTGSQVKLNKAEARISRAYNHFMLLSVFSDIFGKDKSTNPGVPYVTIPEDEVFKKYDRETVDKTLTKIEQDLFEEFGNIGNDANYKQPKFHFTKSSAAAFATRFKLFTEDYAGTIKYANMVLPTPTTFKKNGVNANTDGSDKIFIDQNDAAYIEMGKSLHNLQEYKKYSTDFETVGRLFSSPDATANMLVSEQQTALFRANLANFYSRYSYTSKFLSDLVGKNVTGSPFAVTVISLSGTEAAFWPKFFEDFRITNYTSQTGTINCKFNLFRLEEVLLNRAEAYVMTGEYQKAINDLNMYLQKKIDGFTQAANSLDKDKVYLYYKSRVEDSNNFLNKYNSAKLKPLGVADKSGEIQRALLLTILDFKKVEFLYEGLRYFDILRWNIPNFHVQTNNSKITLEPNDPKRIIQLPEVTKIAEIEPNFRKIDPRSLSSYMYPYVNTAE